MPPEERTEDRQLQGLLDRLAADDPQAVAALVEHAVTRFQKLAHRMFRRGCDKIFRTTDTADIVQGASIRLLRSLPAVKPPSPRAFIGLVATQIRRELIDVTRKFFGAHLGAGNVPSDPHVKDSQGNFRPSVEAVADPASGPVILVQWQEFHEMVQRLPEEEREVFDILYYHGLSQPQAARILGISEATVRRRFREAKALLHRTFHRGDTHS